MNNIEDNSKKSCNGCGGCTVVCPVNAISYELNKYGFFQCYVNEDKCIHCGKCKRACPRFLENRKLGEKIELGKVYSAQSTEKKVLETTTSGGIAYEIARYGIKNKFEILGTKYDYEENIAKAIIVDNEEKLEELKGSKYLQSFTKDAIKDLVKRCKENTEKKFIVFGLPCQIAGITKMLEVNKIKNKIIKIELFCHGVPSYLVWEEYRKYLKEKYKIEDFDKINFRDKTKSWHRYYISILKKEEVMYEKNNDNDLFYKAFFDNILLNNFCQTCEFRKNYSMADIRLGDYWGKRYSNREDGISAILVLTENGQKILNDIIDDKKIEIIDETSTEECINAQSRNDYKYQKLRNEAFSNLIKGKKLEDVIKSYRVKMPMKIKVKYFGKKICSILPNEARSFLKKFYR